MPKLRLILRCRNIAISNCTVSSLCNAIKLGTESSGGFEKAPAGAASTASH